MTVVTSNEFLTKRHCLDVDIEMPYRAKDNLVPDPEIKVHISKRIEGDLFGIVFEGSLEELVERLEAEE